MAIACSICRRVLALPVYRKQPATSSRREGGDALNGRSVTPPGASSTANSVSGSHPCASRTALGRITCPFVDSFVVSIAIASSGKILVRLVQQHSRLNVLYDWFMTAENKI